MREVLRRARHRAVREFKAVTRKPFARYLSPFPEGAPRPPIVHCCYHKVGTVWFARIFTEVAAEFGLRYGEGWDYKRIHSFEQNKDCEIFLDFGSHVDLSQLPDYVGSHMIRDPRDLVVSGYFYHLWTDEPWANMPLAEYRGMTYREYLNSLDQDEGLLSEIRRVWFWVPHMVAWDYGNPRMYEIRYEEIIKDYQKVFREMFAHYGFSESAVERCCSIAEKYSFKNMKKGVAKGTKSHLRSGKPGEWQSVFKEEHKRLFKEMYPGSVVALGYESGEDW
jgi:hypothetical protein